MYDETGHFAAEIQRVWELNILHEFGPVMLLSHGIHVCLTCLWTHHNILQPRNCHIIRQLCQLRLSILAHSTPTYNNQLSLHLLDIAIK